MVKSPPATGGDMRDVGLIPGSGRSLGGGHDNPVQYSRLDPVFSPGESPGQRNLAGCSPWGHRESDMTSH